MSDSVDRVFVHALATVRRLPRTGSSRPPPASRLRLYGLYKQSMEGDVLAILPRPTLPVSSPDLSNSGNNNNSVHRYASRDVRIREAQAEIEKWDAWHACAGMSRTDAKREYISTLIETMKEYASGTAESRELVGELEFVWSQIRSQSGSGSDPDDNSGSNGKSSPERQRMEGSRPSLGSMDRAGGVGGGRLSSGSIEQSRQQQKRTPSRPTRTQSGLRVLSPVSQGNSNSINDEPIEGEPDEEEDDEEENDNDDENSDDDNENLDTAPSSPLHRRTHDSHHNRHHNEPSSNSPTSLSALQKTLESHLATLRTEIAALREQLSANHLLASSTYSLGHHYYSLTPTQRFLHRMKLSVRTFGLLFLRQLVIQIGVLAVIVLWGRYRGDLTIELWVRGLLTRWRAWLGRMASRLGRAVFWVLDLFGRDGRLGFIARVLRIV